MKVSVITALAISAISVFFSHTQALNPVIRASAGYLDYAVGLLLLMEVFAGYRKATYKWPYFKRNLISIGMAAAFFLFLLSRLTSFPVAAILGDLAPAIVIIRNTLILLGVFTKYNRLSAFLEQITIYPARTILVSFLIVILVGTTFLMMPFTTSGEHGLSFINALFTATSAVCVTGLIVVDTATAFSIYGKLIILALIQVGGLGIMILSYFLIFILRRSVSLEDKMLISYVLSERDMTKLAKSLTNIIATAFIIEGIGTALLLPGFLNMPDSGFPTTVMLAVFHSVSAFCNAGFSLFSDSLEGFRGSPYVITVLSVLIIFGGISFAVITDVRQYLAQRIKRFVSHQLHRPERISINTKVVLTTTAFLLLAGTLTVYGLEHGRTLQTQRLGTQYLSAFFQSVTLRTAGFNTIPFDSLRPVTYIAMALFMFVGGASGSTAGGVKISTLVIMFSYLSSSVRDRESVTLFKSSVPIDTVVRAFLIFLFGVSLVAIGTVLLLLFEDASSEHIIFETVSAFGTVGLSAGITQNLSVAGKIVVSVLMYLGRIGPLTVLAAASLSTKKVRAEYPRSEIAIG